MSTLHCPACDADQRDGALCKPCTAASQRHLAALPGLFADLRSTYALQVTRRTGVVDRNPFESPVPFDARAGQVADQMIAFMARWIELVRTEREGRGQTGRTMAAWSRWMTASFDRIRRHEAAGQFHHGLADLVDRAQKAVDLPPEQQFVRQCPVCKHGIFAPHDAEVAVCRHCRRAGVETVEWPVSETRLLMTEGADDQLATAGAICHVLGTVGMPVKVHTIHDWAKASRGGRLQQRGSDRMGRALYRVGDVRALATEHVQRTGRKRNTKPCTTKGSEQ